jgi:hypothetical protein
LQFWRRLLHFVIPAGQGVAKTAKGPRGTYPAELIGMLAKIAKIWGALFVVIGLLGFWPAVTPHGHLLGLFHVNPLHNFIHILTGVVALACGFKSSDAAQHYFQAFGILYALVAVLGFFVQDGHIFGLVANNLADAWLHLFIAAVSLGLGFSGMRNRFPGEAFAAARRRRTAERHTVYR